MAVIFLLAAASRAALFALGSSFLAVVAFAACNALLLSSVLWHSVPERASYGTEYAFGAQKGFLWYATHSLRHSVLKIGFYGTEGIFGTGNSLLWYGMKQTGCGHCVASSDPRMQLNAGPGSRMRLL